MHNTLVPGTCGLMGMTESGSLLTVLIKEDLGASTDLIQSLIWCSLLETGLTGVLVRDGMGRLIGFQGGTLVNEGLLLGEPGRDDI